MYNKVSIPKAGDGAGCAVPKNPTIILIDVDDVTVEPTRSHGNVALSGNYTLKQGEKAVGIYATPSTIEEVPEYEGDVDARGLKQGLAFEHPGNEDAVANFREHSLNRGFIALVHECDGASGRYRAFGTRCNPLFVTPEVTNSKEGSKTKFTLKQETKGTFEPGVYTGTVPNLADEGSSSSSSSESA